MFYLMISWMMIASTDDFTMHVKQNSVHEVDGYIGAIFEQRETNNNVTTMAWLVEESTCESVSIRIYGYDLNGNQILNMAVYRQGTTVGSAVARYLCSH